MDEYWKERDWLKAVRECKRSIERLKSQRDFAYRNNCTDLLLRMDSACSAYESILMILEGEE